MKAFYDYGKNKTGIYGVTPAEAGGFLKSDPNLEVPD